ncbi:MAG: hypothetical protein WBM44_14110, partial [Waterburya sp.]
VKLLYCLGSGALLEAYCFKPRIYQYRDFENSCQPPFFLFFSELSQSQSCYGVWADIYTAIFYVFIFPGNYCHLE